MRFEEIFFESIPKLHARLQQREFSCLELAQAQLKRASAVHERLNTFISFTPELALAQAKAADRMFQEKRATLLTGIPFAAKDNYCIAGTRTTAGSRMLNDYVAPYTATAVRKLTQAGAVCIGKTNLDEFAMGSSTEYSAFGPTKNPFDDTKVSGGSSGGSAAAVASGSVAFALGSDTGGSIRQPAAFCGVVGVKPSYGRVSRYGLISMASSLDVVGAFARSVTDAAIVLKQLAGQDPLDATTPEQPVDPYDDLTDASLKDLRIGIPAEYLEAPGMSVAVQRAIGQMREQLEHAHAHLVDVHLPLTPQALPAYYVIVPCEVSSNLARYDALTYGPVKVRARTLTAAIEQARGLGFGSEAKRRIMLGTFALSAGYHEAYYGRAQKVRSLIRQEFDQVFKEVDCLLTPTTPTPAFALAEKSDPLQMYLTDVFAVPANLAGICGVSLPVATTHTQPALPIGVQVLAPQFAEAGLLKAARALEQQFNYQSPEPLV